VKYPCARRGPRNGRRAGRVTSRHPCVRSRCVRKGAARGRSGGAGARWCKRSRVYAVDVVWPRTPPRTALEPAFYQMERCASAGSGPSGTTTLGAADLHGCTPGHRARANPTVGGSESRRRPCHVRAPAPQTRAQMPIMKLDHPMECVAPQTLCTLAAFRGEEGGSSPHGPPVAVRGRLQRTVARIRSSPHCATPEDASIAGERRPSLVHRTLPGRVRARPGKERRARQSRCVGGRMGRALQKASLKA